MTLELTKRQENILEKIIRKYIKEVQPISSNFLKEEYNLEISPATIRAELARLDEDCFLEQVHISGGRIPTNKAYKEKKKEEKIKIYIGRENTLKEKEFSIIITEVSFPRKEKGILAILGPERMAYDKNISLLNSLTKLLEEN